MIFADVDRRNFGGRRAVSTGAWRVTVPPIIDEDAPLLVIPTVHPRGDRRIVRCAQAALDAGFRIHLLWLGEGDDVSTDPAVGETLFPSPRHAADRIQRVKEVSRSAEALGGDMWHIHDFYFLRRARRWAKRTGRRVLYDVHEYYADYYSGKLPLPTVLRKLVARLLERYQVTAASRFGGANVVTEQMAESFRSRHVPVAVSPNYPLLAQFEGLPSSAFAERRWNVLHIGTLSPEYGTQLMIDLARRSRERGLRFTFSAIARFPSPAHEDAFRHLADVGAGASNLQIIPPRPAHEMPALLATAGFGLSLLAVDGQNEAAVPSKNYEYVMAGLVDVVSDRAAQTEFARVHAVGVTGHHDDVDAMLDAMLELAERVDTTDEALKVKASAARECFTWESAVEPGLKSILRELLGKGSRQ